MNRKLKIAFVLTILVISVSLVLLKIPGTEANQTTENNKCYSVSECRSNIESTGSCGCREKVARGGEVCSAGCV